MYKDEFESFRQIVELDEAANAELVELEQFFAPTSNDAIDSLIAQYDADKKKIEEVSGFVTNGNGGAIQYFLDGNEQDSRYGSSTVERIFKIEGAMNALNTAYWSKALSLTDVFDCMPQKRRNQWQAQLSEWKKPGYKRGRNPELDLPDFDENTVRDTLQRLLLSRSQFFAERVEGIFKALSGEHVTNSPAGFGKRMIVSYVITDYGTVNHDRAGYINDLRTVIAKFMGRDEPRWNATSAIIDGAKRQWGKWLVIDGGSIKIRVYKVGTAHIEVHPEMAWRLNAILASLYPGAIPAEFRRRPVKLKKAKEFQMMERPLPFAVLECLSDIKINQNILTFGYSTIGNKTARDEAEKVLRAIGGVRTGAGDYEFDYNPKEVISEIIYTGCIPDQRSYQFYPTPEDVGQRVIEIAEIGEEDDCLEPEAGQGGLADLMPKDRTLCVEISALHCGILEAKGYNTVNDDFIAWSQRETKLYDRIIMNPPFQGGRAMGHVETAMKHVKPGGRIVAVLPASFRNKPIVASGWEFEWFEQIDNAFAGTSISVTILKAFKIN
jgi:hypothetical protein